MTAHEHPGERTQFNRHAGHLTKHIGVILLATTGGSL